MDFMKSKKRAVNSPPILLFYGPPGIGKSSLGIGSSRESEYQIGKDNHLLINIDYNGADELICHRVTDLIGDKIKSSKDLQNIIDNLEQQKHDFSWLVFDDLSSLEYIFINEICQEYEVNALDKINYGKGSALAQDKFVLFLSWLRHLQEKKPNIGIILLAHATVENVTDPMSNSYMRTTLQLSKKIKEILIRSVDAIGLMHNNVVVMEDKDKSYFGKKGYVPVGNSERIISFATDNASFESKDRLKLPDKIPLDWDIFENALREAYAERTQLMKSDKKEKK